MGGRASFYAILRSGLAGRILSVIEGKRVKHTSGSEAAEKRKLLMGAQQRGGR